MNNYANRNNTNNMNNLNNSLNQGLPVKRKTRAEDLEDRLAEAELYLESIDDDLKNAGYREVEKLNQILNEVRAMKEKVTEISNNDDKLFESELKAITPNALVFINNDKLKAKMECDKIRDEMKKQQEMMNKMVNEQMEQKVQYEKLLKRNNELLDKESELQDKLAVMQSKAYGFDAAQKVDLYKSNQKRNFNTYDQHDPLRHKIDTQMDHQPGYNFWEKENKIGHSTRLDDLAKEKDLWVNNQDKNVHKLVNDIDRSGKINNNVGGNYGSNSNSNNYYGGTNLNSNKNVNPNVNPNANSGGMGKYTGMILNNNQNQLNNSVNKSNTYGKKF